MRGLRLLLFLAVVSAGALLFGAPAHAVQTTTWGITAAHGTTMVHSSDGSTVHESVLVYNRTGAPITIDLYVLDTSYRNGVYVFSKPTSGLAARVTLGTHTVSLRPYQQVQVPVSVALPRGIKAPLLAGIGAEAAPINHGELSLREQLVVLLKATPTSHLIPIHLAPPDVAGWGAAASGLLVLVIFGVFRQKRAAGRLSPLLS